MIGAKADEADGGLIVFPAHALLILEERLKEQEAGDLPSDVDVDVDVTDFALRLLVAAQTPNSWGPPGRSTSVVFSVAADPPN